MNRLPSPPLAQGHEPRDFWPEASALIQAETRATADMVMRWLTIAVVAIALSVATGRLIFVAWAVVYVALDAVYLASIRRQRQPVYVKRYAAILGVNALTSSLYTAMPLYLIIQPVPGLTFVGVCGFLGLCLHNLVRHRGLTHVAIWDMVLMGFGTGIVIYAFASTAESVAEAALIIVGILALAAYFTTGYLGTLRIRNRLATVEAITPEAQKMEAVGRLTGGVAHDFNNILTVIMGNLELYDEIEAQADRDAVVAEARAAALRAATLTSQLLSFSRRATLRPEQVDLPKFLDGFGRMCARVLPANVTLDITPPPLGLTCHADPNQLSTALLNLVINARDAMPDGGTITFLAQALEIDGDEGSLQRSDGEWLHGRYVALSVDDEGPGIPEADLEEVKTPFYTTKPLGKGSGLGLSMVHGFAEQTEGHLLLANRPTGGLSATLFLPDAPPVTRRRL